MERMVICTVIPVGDHRAGRSSGRQGLHGRCEDLGFRSVMWNRAGLSRGKTCARDRASVPRDPCGDGMGGNRGHPYLRLVTLLLPQGRFPRTESVSEVAYVLGFLVWIVELFLQGLTPICTATSYVGLGTRVPKSSELCSVKNVLMW